MSDHIFILTQVTYNAENLAMVISKKTCLVAWVPIFIIMDRDTMFTFNFSDKLHVDLDTRYDLSTAFFLWTNGNLSG